MTLVSLVFERPAARRGAALALAAALGLACADAPRELADAATSPTESAAARQALPAGVETAPPEAGRPEAVYRRLQEEAALTSGEARIALDDRLRSAESEYPLEFRFSYERAKLAVFGRHEHDEAFGRLRRAAEKAIETGRSETMLEMLRSDGAESGAFSKLARGHSEWREILAALELRDRDALWHERHDAAPRARAVHATHAAVAIHPTGEDHAATEAYAADEPHEAAPAADLTRALERLRGVRVRMGEEQSP